MNRVLTCVGEYAATPLYIDKVYVNIYSAEELCYVLYENAFLIDKDILDRKLVDWIDKELKLSDLARDLTVLINQNASAAAFVGTILSYVGYYSKDEISKAESILRMNVSLNIFEKWKAKADFMAESRHYILAIREYEKLLRSMPDTDLPLIAAVYNNLGVAYMNLFLCDSALKCFEKSYEADNNPEAFRHMLIVKRMSMSDEDYIKEIALDESSYKASITIETDMEEARKAFDKSEQAQNLNALFELKNTGDSAEYYEKIGRIAAKLKDDYRDIVLEAAHTEIAADRED